MQHRRRPLLELFVERVENVHLKERHVPASVAEETVDEEVRCRDCFSHVAVLKKKSESVVDALLHGAVVVLLLVLLAEAAEKVVEKSEDDDGRREEGEDRDSFFGEHGGLVGWFLVS